MGQNVNILDPEKTRKIEQILRHNPRGMTISHLSARLNMNRNLVAKYLDVLHYSGRVEMQVTGTAKVYFLSHRVPISAMLEFSSGYIIVLDERLRILQVNGRLLSLLGLGREEVAGRRIDEIDHPLLRDIPLRKLPPDMDRFEDKPDEISVLLNGRQYYFSVKQVPMVFDDGSYGQSFILEDISGRRIADEKIRAYMHQQDFFSKKLQEFAEIPPSANIYAAIGSGLNELLPEAIIDVNAYDPGSRTFVMRGIFGERGEELIKRFSDATKYRQQEGFPYTLPVYDSVPALLGPGKLFLLPGRVHYACFEQIPPDVSEEIEKEFNLGDFYSIGLVWRGTLLGNIMFILRNGSTLTNIPFIEIYAKAASIALQRHIAESAHLQKRSVPERRRMPVQKLPVSG
jgi:PAS domain S-box-containing protein